MVPIFCMACLVQPPQMPSGLSSEKWSVRAEAELQSKNWQALNSTSLIFTKEHSSNGRAWGYLAISLLGLDRPAEAELALETGIKAEPTFLGNWYNLGLVRCQLNRPPDSIKACLDELVRLSPESALQFSKDKRISEAISIPSEILVDMGKLDFDKYPSKKLNQYPPYPPEAKIRRVQGTVWVDLIVDASGRTISVGSTDGPSLLIQPALLCAIQTRFPPLIREGLPRAYKLTYGIPFRLR